MQQETEFIVHDFKLPNHSNEISKADEVINKLKEKLKEAQEVEYITDRVFLRMYEDIVKVLDYVGRLSMPAFTIVDELEDLYIKQYPHSPQLAKKLWLDHYDSIHHPYTILKNRCYRMLEELDAHYHKCNEKHPPNWKY